MSGQPLKVIQSVAARPHHLYVSRTTQYLQHPSTLKAEIWLHPVAKMCSHKKFQPNHTGSSRDMVKYVEKITKKEGERKSPRNDQKIRGKWP